MKPEPDWARAVALARRERGVRGGRGGRRGLVFTALLVAGLHAAAGFASLGAASDVPIAQTREVDVMKFSKLAAAGAVMVASAAFAGGKVPPGWMEVADSQAQFSSVQGQDGWRYLFDRGAGTPIQSMQYFTVSGWCAGSTFGNGGSYCLLHGQGGHPGDVNCGAVAGLERPIRRWTASVPLNMRLIFNSSANPFTTGIRIDIRVDGQVVYSRTLTPPATDVVDWTAEFAVGQNVEILVDPLGNCGADGFGTGLRVLTSDCNANLIPDAVEIAAGSVYDRNHDGVPDVCQCLADVIENGIVDGADLAALLTVWGTDGGIYPRADTNADGVVDANDLAVVLGGWGACP